MNTGGESKSQYSSVQRTETGTMRLYCSFSLPENKNNETVFGPYPCPILMPPLLVIVDHKIVGGGADLEKDNIFYTTKV